MVLHTGREYNELLFSLYVCGFKVALKLYHYPGLQQLDTVHRTLLLVGKAEDVSILGPVYIWRYFRPP